MSLTHLALAAGAALLAATSLPDAAAAAPAGGADARARRFVQQHEAAVRPLEIEANLAYWAANVTGKEEDFKKKEEAETKVDLYLANPERFAELKALKQAKLSDPLLERQIEVLYLEYLGKQLDHDLLRAMLAKDNAIQRLFNVCRPKVNGKEITDNEVRRVLRESKDSAERRAVWEAGKRVGQQVAGELRQLVALRNQAARKLGFSDYHAMQLYLGEQDQGQLLKLFDELDGLTRAPFRAAKAEIDAALAKSYGVKVEELRPWHYHDPFFQEAPAVLGELPDSVYKSLDPIKVCGQFYAGIGLPIDDVLRRSDLYEKPGKNPHAFCTDIDRAGDVRILENVVPGREWLETSLHELGHAAYSKYVGCGKGDSPHLCEAPSGPFRQMGTVPFSALPYLLHTDAHPLCTEGMAMMFDRFSKDVDWLIAMGANVPNPEQFRAAAMKLQRSRLLIFSRYCQVMFRFELAMYAKPDQDLNRLWWDLVEKYQEVKRPEGRNQPDYASKYHFTGAPAYYHNYQLGEMFASQVHHALVAKVLPGTKPAGAIYVGKKAAGEFIQQRVFQPGLSLNWNELTRHATGEELSPKAFAEDLKASP